MINNQTRVLNCVPSNHSSNDWTYEDGYDAGLLERLSDIPPQESLEETKPAAFNSDLRTDWWIVGDQGETGSCVGWAVEAALRYHFTKAGYIKTASNCSFSIQQLWMSAKQTCRQGSGSTSLYLEKAATQIKTALDTARKYGVVEESVLPFNHGNCAFSQNSFSLQASRHRLMAYLNLGRDAWTWIQWLKSQGPIIARLDVDNSWMDIGPDGKLLRYERPYHGGHAVCLVGFKNGRFIIRNSWGKNWGNQGYAFASVVYVMSAITEAYGILGVHRLPLSFS